MFNRVLSFFGLIRKSEVHLRLTLAKDWQRRYQDLYESNRTQNVIRTRRTADLFAHIGELESSLNRALIKAQVCVLCKQRDTSEPFCPICAVCEKIHYIKD